MNAKPKSTRNKLRSQKDGRLFAIDLLEKIERAKTDQFCAYANHPNGYGKVRNGPQDETILRKFELVMYSGSPQAILGFFCVMSDFIGTAHEGYCYPSSYKEWERRGKLQFWRLPMHDLSKRATGA